MHFCFRLKSSPYPAVIFICCFFGVSLANSYKFFLVHFGEKGAESFSFYLACEMRRKWRKQPDLRPLLLSVLETRLILAKVTERRWRKRKPRFLRRKQIANFEKDILHVFITERNYFKGKILNCNLLCHGTEQKVDPSRCLLFAEDVLKH